MAFESPAAIPTRRVYTTVRIDLVGRSWPGADGPGYALSPLVCVYSSIFNYILFSRVSHSAIVATVFWHLNSLCVVGGLERVEALWP